MDVGLVCEACCAFNPMGAQRCLRCGDALSLDRRPARATSNPLAASLHPPPPAASARAASVPGPAARAASTPAPAPAPRRPSSAHAAPPPSPDSAGPLSGPTDSSCPTCGAYVTPGNKFCGNCGGRMPEVSGVRPRPAPPLGDKSSSRRTMFFGAMQAARARLTLIRGDGLDGVSFTLAGEDHYAGRVDCPLLFPDDPFLSPVHANFFYREGKLVVRDERSANGVFLRIHGTRRIELGARFLVGEQVLEVQAGDDAPEHVEDGTYFFASPRRPSHLRVVQTLRGGDSGIAHRGQSDVVSIGREGNDINFPDDPFISGHHAQLSWDGHHLTLTDMGSKNGTFLRIGGEQVLSHGDYVFMGQQLLRVEIV